MGSCRFDIKNIRKTCYEYGGKIANRTRGDTPYVTSYIWYGYGTFSSVMRYVRIRMKSGKMNMRDEYRTYEKALEGQKACDSKGARKIQKSPWIASCRESSQGFIYCGDSVIYECWEISVDACAYREKHLSRG
jgi:hypothetical protein